MPPGTYEHAEAQLVLMTNQGAPVSLNLQTFIGGFFGGDRVTLNPTLRMRLGETFSTELSYQRNDVDLPWGEFVTNLVRTRVSYSFNPRTFVQGLVQYNDRADLWSVNLRFGWLQAANTGLFRRLHRHPRALRPDRAPGAHRSQLHRQVQLHLRFAPVRIDSGQAEAWPYTRIPSCCGARLQPGLDATMHIHTIETRTHGRYLVDRPDGDGPFPVLVGFHGYSEGAERMLEELRRVRGERPWLLVSIQALNRFYSRASTVVGQLDDPRGSRARDRRQHALRPIGGRAVRRDQPVTDLLVYAGFSQGVAMAYRAAAFVAADGIPRPTARFCWPATFRPMSCRRCASCRRSSSAAAPRITWYSEAKAANDLERFTRGGRRAARFTSSTAATLGTNRSSTRRAASSTRVAR